MENLTYELGEMLCSLTELYNNNETIAKGTWATATDLCQKYNLELINEKDLQK